MSRHDVPLPDVSPHGSYRPVVAAGPAGPYEPPRIHNQPGPRHWDPIVVDAAAPQFQARPPTGESRPDTICDGWSVRDFTVRMASIRGDSHRHAGIPRQDAALVTVHRRTGTVLFAVMDGVSSAKHSALGADAVGDAVLRTLWQFADDGPAVDWTAVFEAAADALLRHRWFGLQADETAAEVERRLGTTVVAGAVRPVEGGHAVTVARVGDSGAWLLRDGRYTPLFAPKGDGSPTVTSAVAALPRVPERIEVYEGQLAPGSVLIAATDGIGDPLGDGTGLVGRLFADVLATPPPILGLAHAVDFSRETFDDDRTLLAVWPHR